VLKVDVYESGVGETTVITFPSGGIGIVDAHPSQGTLRPAILDLVKGKQIHFVCLSHPHADHGIDLVPIVKYHSTIAEFWHTVSDIAAFFFFPVTETENFPSPMRPLAAAMRARYAKFLIDLFHAVVDRKIKMHQLRSDLRKKTIDGVEVHCISPEETIQHEVIDAYRRRHSGEDVDIPDSNLLSAILVIIYAGRAVILGADALKKNWQSAIQLYRKLGLPRASILKVPHHGASNSIILHKKSVPNYLDICARNPDCHTVFVGGDSKHPDRNVFLRVRNRSNTVCISNGLRASSSNPLNVAIPGARAANPASICNPHVSIEIGSDGTVVRRVGGPCSDCAKLN
jgi:hypothetical protein